MTGHSFLCCWGETSGGGDGEVVEGKKGEMGLCDG